MEDFLYEYEPYYRRKETVTCPFKGGNPCDKNCAFAKVLSRPVEKYDEDNPTGKDVHCALADYFLQQVPALKED